MHAVYAIVSIDRWSDGRPTVRQRRKSVGIRPRKTGTRVSEWRWGDGSRGLETGEDAGATASQGRKSVGISPRKKILGDCFRGPDKGENAGATVSQGRTSVGIQSRRTEV